ncbi:MAG: isoprenylcysteine carboxylmethyltransferase family protein [Bacteroidota bacterium]
MRIKILPPLVMLIFAGGMYTLAHLLPVGQFDFFGRKALAIGLLGLAALVMILALFQFRKMKTTTNPIDLTKTSSLVTHGIFKYTRNPMYLAMLLILLAYGLKLSNAFNTLIAAGFVYYMNYFQIRFEEEALEKKYGKVYSFYKKNTRRWF